MDLSMVPYGHISEVETKPFEKNGQLTERDAAKIRYRECLRNHAASIGGHANDGCGEFMPAGEEGTAGAIKCAACGCHRNFHRKEVGGCSDQNHPPLLLYNAGPRWEFNQKKLAVGGGGGYPTFLHCPAAAAAPMIQPFDRENRRSETPEGDVFQGSTGSKKRFRTKFTQDQKDKMLAFAEKLGWRIQKHDDVALQQFCMEVGVKRHVLKVWMHNNKNTLGKKETTAAGSAISV